MRKNQLLFAVFCGALVLACGQRGTPSRERNQHSRTERVATVTQVSDKELFSYPPAWRYFTSWRLPDAETTRLFKARDYAALNALGIKLRQERVRDSDGQWRLRSYYQSLSEPANPSALTYDEFISRLHEWEAQFPNSVTPKVALAHTLTNYAWFARGSGWASSVTDDGWRLMNERLSLARKCTVDALAMTDTCPDLYAAMHGFTMAEGTLEDNRVLLEEATKCEPLYTDFYLSYAYCLLPRWKGTAEDSWLIFTTEAADLIGGSDGNELYARIITHIFGFEPDIMTWKTIDWDRMKLGYDSIIDRFPGAKWSLNAYGVFAAIRRDRETVKRITDRIGTRPYLSVWVDQNYYEAVRAWAAGSSDELPKYPWP